MFLPEVSANHRYTEEELDAIIVGLLYELLAYEEKNTLYGVGVDHGTHFIGHTTV